ncbi:hypothetical protein BKA62DRAFT_686741 [Auriculariales sp. MPI-PUGE-AT-0066]|nr:hypothetical protein BKA62DRAFT_686741 [Auriculariales sp. MPI-PUGE-AT-0066]
MRTSKSRQDIEHILDPSYQPRPATSPCPSLLMSCSSQANSDIWTDSAGNRHDPDFRPFAKNITLTPLVHAAYNDDNWASSQTSPINRTSLPLHTPPTSFSARTWHVRRQRFSGAVTEPSPTPTRRSSLDYTSTASPLSLPPTQEERNAARSQLDPELRHALHMHEREVERAQHQQGQSHDCLPRWMRRHRASSAPPLPSSRSVQDRRHSTNSNLSNQVQQTDDDDDDTNLVSSPPLILPDLLSEDDAESSDHPDSLAAAEDNGEDQSLSEPEQRAHIDAFRKQLVGLTLKVDLAVFRARRRFKHRVGLA